MKSLLFALRAPLFTPAGISTRLDARHGVGCRTWLFPGMQQESRNTVSRFISNKSMTL